MTGAFYMSPFQRRLFHNWGDIRCDFWSDYLINKRLDRGLDSAGRKLYKIKIGQIIF